MSLKKKFRQIKKLPDFIYPPLAFFLKIWYMTTKKEFNGKVADEPVILACWHNRLIFSVFPYEKGFRKRTYAIASPSRDGQYVADLIQAMGVKAVIRGSSKKRGAEALFEAIKRTKEGYNICMTPDGPRGPKYELKEGAVMIASKSNAKIQPYIINASSYWSLKSWDNFQIPKPFSKITINFGEPIDVPRKLSKDDVEKYRKLIEDEINKLVVD